MNSKDSESKPMISESFENKVCINCLRTNKTRNDLLFNYDMKQNSNSVFNVPKKSPKSEQKASIVNLPKND